MTKGRKAKPIGEQLIRVGNNEHGELCVQIIMSIPIAELFAREIGRPLKRRKK